MSRPEGADNLARRQEAGSGLQQRRKHGCVTHGQEAPGWVPGGSAGEHGSLRVLVVGRSVLPFGPHVGAAELAGYYLAVSLAEILDWIQVSPWEYRFRVAADAPQKPRRLEHL